ncbi:hypothetical protein SeLEV6574_g07267, partial [Synchytrium endobioticum]
MSAPAAPTAPALAPRRPASPNAASANAATTAALSSRPTSGSSTRIGPYLLGKTLGVGSTGRVKLGTHIETTQRVAIKIISRESLPQTQSLEKKSATNMKIEREITIMRLIQHPHVLQLFDVYESDKELFLILEHVEGGELFDYLVKKGRLMESEALKFFQQIVFALDFCHRHLICHRDLKPENVLLDKDLNIKIADFGMASLQVNGKMLETSCGSPHYASPEVIKGVKYDGQASDIWSCGVMLYALLTGNLPFDDENIRRLLSKVKSGMYTIPDFVSPDARDLIKKMLVIDPAQRITIKGIMEHPWFTSQSFKPHDQMYLKGALDNKEAFSQMIAGQPLDTEILASLGLLGWGNDKELRNALKKPVANIEKVFYFLLSSRKMDLMENFDVRKLHEWDIEGGPRRRADSFVSLSSGKSGSRPDLSSSPALSESARKSIEELRQKLELSAKSRDELSSSRPTTPTPAMGHETVISIMSVSRDANAEGDTVAKKTSAPLVSATSMAVPAAAAKSARPVADTAQKPKVIHASVKVNSPLATSVTSAHEKSYLQPASMPAYSVLDSAGSSLTSPSPMGAASTDLLSSTARALSIAIPTHERTPSNASSPSSAAASLADGVPGTPRFHRRK